MGRDERGCCANVWLRACGALRYSGACPMQQSRTSRAIAMYGAATADTFQIRGVLFARFLLNRILGELVYTMSRYKYV
jgi:hypothetical protein